MWRWQRWGITHVQPFSFSSPDRILTFHSPHRKVVATNGDACCRRARTSSIDGSHANELMGGGARGTSNDEVNRTRSDKKQNCQKNTENI